MLVHIFLMRQKLEELQDNWKTSTHFETYINHLNNTLFSQSLKEILRTTMPTMFFKLAIKIIAKHFNQWKSPKLFPLSLAGEVFSTTAILQRLFTSLTTYVLPETYNSTKHKSVINLKQLVTYATKNLPTPNPIRTRELYLLHSDSKR